MMHHVERNMHSLNPCAAPRIPTEQIIIKETENTNKRSSTTNEKKHDSANTINQKNCNEQAQALTKCDFE